MSARDIRLIVLLITYNHAHYIRRALQGVFAQQIDEPFKIVVADDGSSDETLSIIRDEAARHPQIEFQFLPCTGNLGITRNYQRAFAACRAEYVAVLEGDDYWVSPKKLSRQRDFLDERLECDLCSVNYYVYEEARAQFTPRISPEAGHLILGARELIADNLVGNFSTCMYRKAALERLPPELFEIKAYDWAINICVARWGLIGFIREPLSVYRIHGDGAWNVLPHINKLQTQLELIPAYDRITDHVFTGDFAVLSARITQVIEDMQHQVAPSKALPAASVISVPPLQSRILDATPPFLLFLGRQLLPPALKRRLTRFIFKS